MSMRFALSSKIFRTKYLVKRCLEETAEIRQLLHRLEASSALPFEGGTAWSPELKPVAQSLLALLSPVSLRGLGKVRLGSDHDGGYVVPADWERVQGLVSLGVGPENSFDLAFAERGVQVQSYDHSIQVLPQTHPGICWYREKIASVDQPNRREVSLAKALARFGENISLALKMDIEGHEYAALLACPERSLARVRFITGEFHGLASAIASSQSLPIAETFLKLKQHFEVVHIHANNLAGCRLCGGFLIPQHLEITWANRQHYAFQACNEIFPTPLDRPNFPGKADLFLGAFQHDPGWKSHS